MTHEEKQIHNAVHAEIREFEEFKELVKRMREAQKKYGGEVDVCIGYEEGLDKMYELEDKVDEYLKKIG